MRVENELKLQASVSRTLNWNVLSPGTQPMESARLTKSVNVTDFTPTGPRLNAKCRQLGGINDRVIVDLF